MINLRSDTFTLPTVEMRAAILSAELGDDGYREDPTVIRLEELAAKKLGKESACLMPSGTMANLCSILAWRSGSGTVVLVGDQSDIYVYEDQTVPGWAGVIYQPVPTRPDGTMRLSDIQEELRRARPDNCHVKLLCLENPHNLCGGVVLDMEYLREVADLIHAQGLGLHLDGARLFNAAARLKISPSEIVQHSDSVQFCLSKGLAAPVGSILAGASAFIERVRIQRKMLGGNMRQAGIVAAAGLVALEQMTDRLDEDHTNAWLLAQGLALIPGIQIDLSTIQTNTVVFRVTDPRFDCESFIGAACREGLHLSEFERGRIRAVPHYGITASNIRTALKIVAQIMSEKPVGRSNVQGKHRRV